jgi:T5SS/PEP-CTERM-associated repeat protein
MTVGGKGNGSLTVEDGGNLTVNASDFTIGDETSGVGVFTLDGADSSLTFKGEMDIGEDGTGTFALQDGASFTAHAINVGDRDGTGTLNVDGAGTFLEVLTDFNVGEGGSGALNVTDNAELKSDIDTTIADKGGSSGTATVASAGSWNVAGNLTVGGQSIGELDIKTAASVAAHDMTIGDSYGAEGTVKVTGTGTASTAKLTYDNTLTVGNNGTGHLDVTDGGSVAPTGQGTGQVVIGAGATGNGEVTVDGSTSHFEANSLQIGISGTGMFFPRCRLAPMAHSPWRHQTRYRAARSRSARPISSRPTARCW